MATSVPTPAAAYVRPSLRAAALSLSDLPRRFGRYVLLRRIAKGGMGEVMLATTLGLEGAERPLIIKTIRTEHRTDKSFKARFLDEARVQAQLEHAGVCQVLEATTDDDSGEPYVVVEFVDGRSLGDVRARALTSGQRIEWHEAVAIAQLAAEALAHVHERHDAQNRPLNIVHRDLSPQNLMIGYGGEVKIIDFGTARGENRRCHTVSGVVFAKPGYVAPEVANGNPGDFRVDLYALGVMLWELCAGRRFLEGEASDHMAAVSKNLRNLPPIAEVAGAPRALDDILARLTAFDREGRYARTKVAARELASLLTSAAALAGGERGVRSRVAGLMQRLFDGESARNRREFLRLVAEARKVFSTPTGTPQAPTPKAAIAMKEEKAGFVPGTRYKVVREIGKGAGTVVVEAEHVDLGRRAAVKMLESATAPAMAQARFRREARILSSLEVPGVVRVIDAGETTDQRPFVVLELCEGETLEKTMKREGGVSIDEALEISARILTVLDRVHARGVVHRDLKPENIVLAEDRGVTLVDFGIAIAKGDRDMSDLETPSKKQPSISLYGTPEYMAPEQAARPHEVDARADIYAVGAMLYEMLTGRLPFVGASAVAILEAKAQGSPEAPSERAKARNIPADVDALCLRALARHPSLRFGAATEMREAIEAALAAPGKRRSKIRRVGMAALATTMMLAGSLGAVTLVKYPDAVKRATGWSVPGTEEPQELADEGSAPEGAAVEAPAEAPATTLATTPPTEPAPEPKPLASSTAEARTDEPREAKPEAEPADKEDAAPAPKKEEREKARRAEKKKDDGNKKKPRKRKSKRHD